MFARLRPLAVCAVILSLLIGVSTSIALGRVGARASSFSLPFAAGGTGTGRFNLADHLGRKPIVILFWATWCAPCRQEMPVYNELFQQYRARGLTVVGVSMDNATSVAQVGPTARRLGIQFPIVTDLDTRVTAQLNPRRSAPFSIWIDRSGKIVREREGFTLAERAEIVRGIGELVGPAPAQPPSATRSNPVEPTH